MFLQGIAKGYPSKRGTLIEFKILNFLVQNAKKIVSRNNLKEFVWPQENVLDKTLNTHLSNLRFKISGSNFDIKSIKGEGVLLT